MSRRLSSVALVSMLSFAGQAQNAFIEAARANASAASPGPALAATTIVRVFMEGCVAHEGDSMRTVDWAINRGFEPVYAQGGAAETLLSGRPGTVLALPGNTSPLLLAVDVERRCTVWAERGDGLAVRAEFAKAMSVLASKGALVQPALERTVERGGAWRLQLQMRYRRVGGSQDFGVGTVTTLTAQPAAQALNLAPMPARPETSSADAQGLPVR